MLENGNGQGFKQYDTVMNIHGAVTELADANSTSRHLAIERIYGNYLFSAGECESIRQMLSNVDQYLEGLGAMYYVLECSGQLLESWLHGTVARSLLRHFGERDFSMKLWNGTDFVIWSAAAVSRTPRLPKKASKIALDFECPTDLRYVLSPLFGMDDFSDVCWEVQRTILERTPVAAHEIRLAEEILFTKDLNLPIGDCCAYILFRTQSEGNSERLLSKLRCDDKRRYQAVREIFARLSDDELTV